MRLYDLYNSKAHSIIPTLERIQSAVKYLGLKPSYSSFQVGGTNGKGSTCAFLNSILLSHGYKVGWFISPHLIDETERWRINSEPISEQDLGIFIKELKPIFERFELTYFEACTLIALSYFEEKKVDFAIFEVGMGGRWDATRVCSPVACAITNIQRDHIKWLGEKSSQRALEKLGIYIQGRPLVLGSMRFPLYPLALEVCNQSDLIVGGLDFFAQGKIDGSKTLLESFEFNSFKLKNVRLGLWGEWQIENCAVSIALASSILKLSEKEVSKALETTRWEGRMELIREKPAIFLDGAHNPDAIFSLCKALKTHFPNITPVFSSLKDKEWKNSLKAVSLFFKELYITQINHHRALNLEELKLACDELGIFCHCLESPSEILNLDKDIVVFGSLYLVGEVRSIIKSFGGHK
ncbi:MAG: folylpolyglutamate synthase/dihydrofolate synthase family protein [Aquificaceae bacterium]|nr:folylpolyglutamate synthase/dihydrofolate synthase family protein [Aquificaceae bacterium]